MISIDEFKAILIDQNTSDQKIVQRYITHGSPFVFNSDDDLYFRLKKNISDKYGAKLPYLFKVLPAATALSIQSHPNKKQAEEGWAREEGKGPNYRDDNHKPEIICAITKFWALNGFRPVEDILTSFRNHVDYYL